MNFETIKAGFLSYLSEKQGEANGMQTEEYDASSVSIFTYSSEFKNYLAEEYSADVSIFSKSISEIMSMEIVNGKIEDSDEGDYTAEILNEALSDESVISALDADKSGELSKDEISGFLSGLTSGDSGEISFDTLAEAVTGIQEGSYSVPTSTASTETETETETDTEVESETEAESESEIATEEETAVAAESEIDETGEESTLTDLLNKVYENKTVAKALDIDGDGELSDEEKAQFEEFIKGYDGDDSSLSEDDVKQAMSEIIDGTFSYGTDNLQDTETTIDTDETESTSDSAGASETVNSTGGTSGSSGTSGVSSTGSASSGTTSSVNTSNTEATGTSLEELEEQRDTLESDISSLREQKDAIYSGEGIEEEQAAYDEAKEAYDEAVENDGNIPEGLKQQREENLNAISESEDNISEFKTNINDTEGEISTKEADIASGKSNVNALDSSLQTLESQKSSIETEGEDGDADKLAEIEAKISEVTKEKEAAELQLEKDEAALDDLNKTLDDYNTQLSDEEDLLAELEEERAEIEESITSGVWTDESGNEIKFECSDEVKETLEAFNEAKTALDEAKAEQEEQIKEIDDEISTKQAELDDVNAKIDELKAEETEKENKVSLGDGQELLDALEEAGGDAYENFGKLCDELGMSEDEAAAYITELCESEEWGDGCIDPVLLCAQICQESGYDADIVGDSGAALGLGQFHKCAVDEVNNQYGTNYTYSDRSDPEKALEMMVLLLKYDYSQTGSTDGMLAMYNQGHASAINESAGQNYVKNVYSRLNSYS